jgi:hypothetical protein
METFIILATRYSDVMATKTRADTVVESFKTTLGDNGMYDSNGFGSAVNTAEIALTSDDNTVCIIDSEITTLGYVDIGDVYHPDTYTHVTVETSDGDTYEAVKVTNGDNSFYYQREYISNIADILETDIDTVESMLMTDLSRGVFVAVINPDNIPVKFVVAPLINVTEKNEIEA